MMDREPTAAIEDLFILRGGKVSQTAERFGFARHGKWVVWRVIWVSLLITWVPLVLLATVQDVAWGARVGTPLLKDFLPYTRYFLAVPILVAAEWIVGRRLGLALAELRSSEVVDPEAVATFDAVVVRAVALWRSRYVMAGLVAAVYGVTLGTLFSGTGAAAGTWEHAGFSGNPGPSMAGLWQLLVSAALLRLLTYRWLWRWLIWVWVLWRIARLPLRLSPLHPDRTGGLGFMGSAQTGFAVLILAVSLQLGGLIADAVRYQGAQLADYRGHAVLLVIMALVFAFAPLLAFTGKLARAKWEAEASLSSWASSAGRLLENTLCKEDVARTMEGAQISSLCDYGTLLDHARDMRLVPVSNRDLALVVGAALLPAIPLLFVAMPAKDVLQKILNVVA